MTDDAVQGRCARGEGLAIKLLRYDPAGTPTPGVLPQEEIISLAPLANEYPTVLSAIAEGEAALERIRSLVASANAGVGTPLRSALLLAPIERPGKYLAIGMNYRKHMEETKRLGVAVPTRQYWFNKQTSCLAGPTDDIDPGVTEQLDYGVEVAVVLGRRAKCVSRADAPSCVFWLHSLR